MAASDSILLQIKETLAHDRVLMHQALRTAYRQIATHAVRNQLDQQILDQLEAFVGAGKMFRGGLLLQTFRALCPDDDDAQAVQVAAMVESFGSALLIHDDIMDRDLYRRGSPSIHTHWAEWARAQHSETSTQDGEAIGLAIGDILFFISFELLHKLQLPEQIFHRVLEISTRQMTLLGFSQIEEYRASLAEATSEDELIAIHAGKTGRYTGGWPLSLAAILAGLSDEDEAALRSFGVELGILYQLVDDRLGIFGTLEETGKGSSSDILNGKQTLYRLYAEQQLTGSERELFEQTYGNASASSDEVAEVKTLLTQSGVSAAVATRIRQYYESLMKQAGTLPIPVSAQQLLRAFVELTYTRKR